jgi:coproporphyrinogen III oxidase
MATTVHVSVLGEMERLSERVQREVWEAVERLEGRSTPERRWTEVNDRMSMRSRDLVLEDGVVFERASANTAVVEGRFGLEPIGSAGAEAPAPFRVVGVSVVLHARNPMVPAGHANFRCFERERDGRRERWFGGLAELTPSYLFEEDAAEFHRALRAACDRHDRGYYPRFKAWCDRYFRIAHRDEQRGLGGIFFDRLDDRDPAELLALVGDCAGAFRSAYLAIVERRRRLPYGEAHKRWQALRNGRYVEFNLVYDAGVRFGLRAGARPDTILTSLPATARWRHGHQPSPDSPEAALVEVLRHPREWA